MWNSRPFHSPLFATSRRSCCLCDTLELSSLLKWSRSKQPETSFWADAHVSDATCNMTDEPGGYIPSRCGDSFLLMVFWWGSRFRASNSLELEQPFMPVWLDRPRSRFGSNARLLRSDLSPFNFILFFRSCHQLVPHSVLPPCPSVMCRGVQVCALCWLGPFHRVGWFWRSVCSLSPPRCFGLCPSFVSAFFFLFPFRVDPAPAGCVCACNTCTDVKLLSAGGPWTHRWHGPTKTHLCRRANVPAIFQYRQWQSAEPRTGP